MSVGVLLAMSSSLAWAQDEHVVRGRFDPADGFRALTFTFEVSPPVEARPSVRLLGDPTDPPRVLEVAGEKDRYTVTLRDLAPVAEGRLLIELATRDRIEPHHADFVIRPNDPERRTAHPSLDGVLVLSVDPKDAPKDLALVLTRVELPLDGLPTGVAERRVRATWGLDLSETNGSFAGWVLGIGADLEQAPTLWWRPSGGASWKQVDSLPLVDHAVLTAGVPGAGTWLVVDGGAE